jgi:hypothetical protein
MDHEREHELKWGRSFVGPFIFFVIDSFLQTDPTKPIKGRVADVVNMIVAQLVIDNVPPETLEHLKVNFVRPESQNGPPVLESEDLLEIREILSTEFGQEVVKRINLSLDEKRVRTLPR